MRTERDTYLVISIIIMKTTRQMSMAAGCIAKRMPTNTDTPLPPLNWKKIGKI